VHCDTRKSLFDRDATCSQIESTTSTTKITTSHAEAATVITSRSARFAKRTDALTTSQKRSLPERELSLIEMLASERPDSNRRLSKIIESEKLREPAPCSSSVYSEYNEFQAESEDRGRTPSRQHVRNESLHVNWTMQDIIRMAQEIANGTIAPVHLSLLGYWIRESAAHYEMARIHIRELSLDQVSAYRILVNRPHLTDTTLQGYNVKRVKNEHLRNLLIDIKDIRPK
jgi:hypothetical protein